MWLLALLDHFIPPGTITSANEGRRVRLMVGMLFYGIVVILLSILVRWLNEGWTAALGVVSITGLLFFVMLAAFWLWRNRQLVADMMIISVLLAIGGIAYFDGGLYSRSMTWLAIIPLVANFLGGRIRAWFALFLVAVELAILFWLHQRGAISSLSDSPIFGRTFAFFASTALVSVLAQLYEATRKQIERDRELLDEMQRQWVSVVSHELRTPLTATHSSLSLLVNTMLHDIPANAREMLQIAYRNNQRLTRLVNDVMDMERLRMGKLRLRYEQCNLQQLVEEAVKTFENLSQKKALVFKLDLAPVVSFEADPDRITQVIHNLLSNAIKFSPAHGVISVRLLQHNSNVEIEVHDQGEGVAEEFVEELFKPFTQQNKHDARAHEGSGLGLYISHAIVAMHQGELRYRPGEKGGATFVVSLPAKQISEENQRNAKT
ncbi:sensor histidine kinase [Permianibacter aggregans]|uniref:histidine kinase n=1 Tax=Permianibacter aggregans TaxID=1510150 RepID=A0A4R6U9S5_9GAMM|nr:HAMP domain-containing sensor histidine kinase [Permianibacter aggregans]QGX39699.1 HAMP domain-containing histidine kinase [Permianibacter aggregans]TDQ43231.1 phospho-acceptor domain-containing protein [Permianibacter aggregans]